VNSTIEPAVSCDTTALPAPRIERSEPVAWGARDRLMFVSVLTVWSALVAVLLPYHEPWFDEAQAWLIARDTNPVELVTRVIRYEGTPALWHLLLMVPAKLGMPYFSLNVISAVIALAGVAVFLRFAPFPWPLRAVLPFTYFLFYQYAVVARSYCLIPLLLFSLAALYRYKTARICSFTALLCLLANVSLQGSLVAGGILVVHLYDLWHERPLLTPALRRRQMLAVGAFAITGVLVVLQAYPPADLMDVLSRNRDLQAIALTCVQTLNGAFTEMPLVSLLLLLGGLWCFARRGVLLLYLLPTGLLLTLYSLCYFNVWHEGILLLVWIFALWVGLEKPPACGGWHDRLLPLALVSVLCVVQVSWSVQTYWFDLHENYSASREVARYIERERLQDQVIYATGVDTFAVQPYFPHNLFDNYNHRQSPAFWWWSKKNPLVQDAKQICADQPDVVLVSLKGANQAVPELPGYRQVAICEGTLFWKNRRWERDACAVFRRQDTVSR
jgi:hypothetical protein